MIHRHHEDEEIRLFFQLFDLVSQITGILHWSHATAFWCTAIFPFSDHSKNSFILRGWVSAHEFSHRIHAWESCVLFDCVLYLFPEFITRVRWNYWKEAKETQARRRKTKSVKKWPRDFITERHKHGHWNENKSEDKTSSCLADCANRGFMIGIISRQN